MSYNMTYDGIFKRIDKGSTQQHVCSGKLMVLMVRSCGGGGGGSGIGCDGDGGCDGDSCGGDGSDGGMSNYDGCKKNTKVGCILWLCDCDGGRIRMLK